MILDLGQINIPPKMSLEDWLDLTNSYFHRTSLVNHTELTNYIWLVFYFSESFDIIAVWLLDSKIFAINWRE